MNETKASIETKTGSRLSRRLDGVSESATLRLNAAVQALKQKQVEVFNLTAGEPDFWVLDEAKEAVIEALKANRSKYTPVPGIPELRQAIAEKTNRQQPSVANSQPWKAENVIVTNGGKQALFNSFMALLDAGDEVILPSPYWLSYPEMVKLCGGTSRVVRTTISQGFKLAPEQLKAVLNPRSRILVMNSPSNPTGAMYTRGEFAALARVIMEAGNPDLWIISDEIYDRDVLGDTPFCSFLEAAPELRHRTITVNGMSKSASMTGWRIGWSLAVPEITQALNTLQGQSTSGINALAQWASLAALKLPESAYAQQVESLRRRRNLSLEILKKASKLEIFAPEGAFYVFLGLGQYLKGKDSVVFAEELLEHAKVAVVPGAPFGEPQCVRISFSTDDRSIQEGCERFVKFLESSY